MRKHIAAILMMGTTALAGSAFAADVPYYPPVDVPDVDYGYAGSYYLRGSVGGDLLWTREHICAVGCGGLAGEDLEVGYGYSFGAGFGYETGTGLRTDVTLDHGYNEGLSDATGYELRLRSTILLANAYYDFPISGSAAAGGFGAYVGAGLGGAYLQTEVTGGLDNPPDGEDWSPAAAVMAGVTYDMGALVADVGYRGIYMPQISNSQEGPNTSFYLNDNFKHEVRGTLRYRFN